MKLFIAVVLAAGLGTVVATIWIGSGVREEQVVEQPYETGLRYDADRAARASLGWTARVDVLPLSLSQHQDERAAVAPGASVVRFQLWDGAGAPLDGAAVTVAATRPETSRDRVSAAARGLGEGRYEAELPFAAPGTWELALDVRRGTERLVLERDVTVSDSRACDVAAAPCARPVGEGVSLTLELAPRPLKPFTDLVVTAELRDAAGRPLDGADVAVSFSMPGMFMGENRAALAARGAGRYAGKAVLVRCPSGRQSWRAEASVHAPGMAPATATFDFRVTD